MRIVTLRGHELRWWECGFFFPVFFSGIASYPVTAPCLWDRLGSLQGLGLQVL